uniref:Uncharacterized protein n=1 Tax=Chromera velia CCMP2878 TaxID=1169474 RepID=A0A0G4GUS5_9ALVE|eukprot:Cvel_23400.t1-p1 / transcript=Cvel_23400.t1 / gene=Cvel_23400 / organism=Chromera_velia_CCMP2878 / gene_product=hypothetical protein / transcript_product=hypothetical protein / location=Cvel_scaffold2407:543-3109(-) / protein_length=280 / sequence_SO=supercontig / SO=protein_coding / is_pseudo=false
MSSQDSGQHGFLVRLPLTLVSVLICFVPGFGLVPDGGGDGLSSRLQARPLETPSIPLGAVRPLNFIGWLRGNATAEPHPLRMQRWRVLMRYGFAGPRVEEIVDFNIDGRVSYRDGRRGNWKQERGGITWTVKYGPSEKGANRKQGEETTHFYWAEVQWNPFGAFPKMYKGGVYRDRLDSSPVPKWFFRPCIGTFYGEGCGVDTADPSYSSRKWGFFLSRQGDQMKKQPSAEGETGVFFERGVQGQRHMHSGLRASFVRQKRKVETRERESNGNFNRFIMR